jgi:hypothetical protein
MSSLCIPFTIGPDDDRTPTVRLSAAATVHLLGEDGTVLCGRECEDGADGVLKGAADPGHSAICRRCQQIA